MAPRIDITSADPEMMALFSNKVILKAEQSLFFAFLMTSFDSERSVRSPYADQLSRGSIIWHNEFSSDGKNKTMPSLSGGTITIPAFDRVTGEPVFGDAVLKDTGIHPDIDSMTMSWDYGAKALPSLGPRARKLTAMDLMKQGEAELARWLMRTLDESIRIHLYGLTSWVNSPYINFTQSSYTSLWNNTIQAIDSTDILYCGDATSTTDLDSADKLDVSGIRKAVDDATAGSEPVEPLSNKSGPDSWYVLLVPTRAITDLKKDPTFEKAVQYVQIKGVNPMLARGVPAIDNCIIVEDTKAPYVASVSGGGYVAQSLLLGADCIRACRVEDVEFGVADTDVLNRRKVAAIQVALGMAPTKVWSKRKNIKALRHWVRS